MRHKSVVSEAKQIKVAIELIELGARLQVLESETGLSRERLLRLYKEVKGVSPSKGMLPFSDDWFLSWQPNIHSSLFVEIYRYLLAHTGIRGIEAVIKSYRLYLEHIQANNLNPVLSLTRAWTLVRFMEVLLQTVPCTRCGGHFVVQRLELNENYVCGLCRPPSRAGKSRRKPPAVAPAVAAAR